MTSKTQTIAISHLGKIVTGKTPPTKCPEYYGDNFPFVTPTDLSDDSRYVSTARSISKVGASKFSSSLLPINAVCFTCIASIGKMCMTSGPTLTNQQINSVIVDQTRHDPHYVFYLLRSCIERITSTAGGVATPIINKSAFSDIEISVHDLPTQRKMASILSAYDDLIENNTRRIAILEEMAQTIYREWFVNFRFPGHENVKLVDSPLGKIPQGWEPLCLGDVAKEVRVAVHFSRKTGVL